MDWSSLAFGLKLLSILFITFTGPIFIALCRQVDSIGVVIIICVWSVLTLVALPLAWWAAFWLPRRLPPARIPPRTPPHHPGATRRH